MNHATLRRCMLALPLLALSVFSSVAGSRPSFDGQVLTLPAVQVGEDLLAIELNLINPADLTFQLDLPGIVDLTGQVQGACFDPYFSFDSLQLVIPILELGVERYQVHLDLVDAAQGLFRVSPQSLRLLDGGVPAVPAFTVRQSGNDIVAWWGTPGDDADGYRIWFAPFPSTTPLLSINAGSLTSVVAELPPGADYCLAVSAYGPDGDTDFSAFQHFSNQEVPYVAHETGNPSLPAVFFPVHDDSAAVTLMHSADPASQPAGAAFTNLQDDLPLVVTFHPEHGLLSRLALGEVMYHFVNYTDTTVDVIETSTNLPPRVFPDLVLSNHAIAMIAELTEVYAQPPQELDQSEAWKRSAEWARSGLDMALDILRNGSEQGHSVDASVLDRLARDAADYRGDFQKVEIQVPAGQAAEATGQHLDTLIESFGCDGDSGYGCALFGLTQADREALADQYPDTLQALIELFYDALVDAGELKALLNQDCSQIADEQQREECLQIQGNPDPGQQREDLLPINGTQDDADAQTLEDLDAILAQAEGTVNTAEITTVLELNDLYFAYEDLIGQYVWVLGYYGNENHNADGYAFLVDNYEHLIDNLALPHHSFARLDGLLPPQDWDGAEILVYGEVKDFAVESGLSASIPTPLITVIEVIQISPPDPLGPAGGGVFQGLSALTMPGTQASDCDRALIISGGIDASNDHVRYRQSLAEMHARLKSLGFSDAQIGVFYNNGGAIDVGGSNIVDSAATKQAILAHIAALKAEMTGSCTLTVLVSDHGTGYNETTGYQGARPALTGTDAATGLRYDESSFKMSATRKAWRYSDAFNYRDNVYYIARNQAGMIELFRRDGGNWTFLGSSGNGDNIFSEAEAGVDFDRDGTVEADFGLSVAYLEGRLTENRSYGSNAWDYDGDGTDDVRIRWDGMRFVVERRDGNQWKEMGRDTDGDFDIDAADGGVDWNLDGDKGDKVGFHEGINLWGSEVLWDDELTSGLKELDDMGIHILMWTSTCFSGGFVENLRGVVENIVAGASEDTLNYSRRVGGVPIMYDTQVFLNNLNGIDVASWNHAAAMAIAADNTAAGGSYNNHYTRYETTKYESGSKFEAGEDGEYRIELDIPDELAGQVYDFEFIFGLQQPRWDPLEFGFPDGLPPGMDSEIIPGGFRVFSSSPIPDGLKFRINGTQGSQMMRIELTDIEHDTLGYVMAMPGEVTLPTSVHVTEMTGSFSHFIGFSVVYTTVRVVDSQGIPVPGAEVLVRIQGVDYLEHTDVNGEASFAHTIYSYGSYTFQVEMIDGTNLLYVPEFNVIDMITINVTG